ncbi:hypothetical protein CBS147332_2529 [Penicillium roqueforti]|nr:hypothetical protein CBS147332_2529 [Penicillium roqueforti]KAI3110046.1 hypothetical protein CBS147331_5475 [Penicillium roqueforti]
MDSKTPQISPALETLPFEVRRHILSMVEIDSLKTLVQASPVYFYHYQLERKLLLCQSLESTLGSVTADAYAVHKSTSMECSKGRDSKGIDDFLTSYHTMRSQAWSSPLHNILILEEVETMVKFHCSIVQPLMRCFVREALTNLTEKTNESQIEETLSTTEETRLMREFYRFQLCCNIYGLESAESIPYVSWISVSQHILGDFLYIFDPWEAEELSCVSYFCEEKCEQIFDQTKQGLDEENSGIDQPDISDITSPSTAELTRNRGLELLHLVYPIKDQDHLAFTRHLPPPMRPGGILSDPHIVFEQHLQWHRH